MNIAIPKMMAVFSASTDQIEWVLTGYMLTQGVLIPITGWLQDRFGARRLYLFSLVVFTIGSALCGAAWSTGIMVGARVIQAIGGGMIMPISMSMIYRVIPPKERGLALGIFGIALMFAPALGPTLSGYIVQYMDWRLIFYINLPVGIVGFLLALFMLPKDKPHPNPGKLDLPGFISSVVGLFCLLYALDKGGTEGWTSVQILSLLAISIVSLGCFVWIELVTPRPMLNLRLMKNFTFSMALIVASINSIAMFVGLFLTPLFLQNIAGQTPLAVGLLLLPAAIATAVMMPISGRLFDKFGARWLVVIGLGIAALGTWQFHSLTVTTALSTITFYYIIRNIGMGLGMMPVTTAGMNEVPHDQIGYGSALTNTARQVASSFGVAIFTSLLSKRINFHTAQLSESVQAGSTGLTDMMQKAMAMFHLTPAALYGAAAQGGTAALQVNQAVHQVQGLGMVMLNGYVQQQAFVLALNDVFAVTAIVTLVGAVLGLCFRHRKHEHASGGELPMMEV